MKSLLCGSSWKICEPRGIWIWSISWSKPRSSSAASWRAAGSCAGICSGSAQDSRVTPCAATGWSPPGSFGGRALTGRSMRFFEAGSLKVNVDKVIAADRLSDGIRLRTVLGVLPPDFQKNLHQASLATGVYPY